MKKRIAIAAYPGQSRIEYVVKHYDSVTEVFHGDNPTTGTAEGEVAATVTEIADSDCADIEVHVEGQVISLSAQATESLLVALTAHQQLREHLGITLIKTSSLTAVA